jgi:hypothetical protein
LTPDFLLLGCGRSGYPRLFVKQNAFGGLYYGCAGGCIPFHRFLSFLTGVLRGAEVADLVSLNHREGLIGIGHVPLGTLLIRIFELVS